MLIFLIRKSQSENVQSVCVGLHGRTNQGGGGREGNCPPPPNSGKTVGEIRAKQE